jgi:hypothetical protein
MKRSHAVILLAAGAAAVAWYASQEESRCGSGQNAEGRADCSHGGGYHSGTGGTSTSESSTSRGGFGEAGGAHGAGGGE